MVKLRAGTLNKSVSIQRYYESQDENGNVVGVWVELKKTRASVNPTSGSEIVVNNQIVNNVDNEIFMRFSDVTPKDRIVFNGRGFDVKRALNFEYKNVFLHILAKEDLSYKDAVAYPVVTHDNIPVTYNGMIVTKEV